MVPVDEIDANSGFKFSAVFQINSNNYLVGIDVLGAGRFSKFPPSSGYYYIISSGNGETNIVTNIHPLNIGVNPINITVVAVCGGSCNPFNNPTVNLAVYVNGEESVSGNNLPLPQWNPVSSNTYIYGNTYNGYSVGSWIVVYLAGATLLSSSLKLFNSYTLPSNEYLAVSFNGGPAVGASLLNYTVEPGFSPKISSLSYAVCNVTDNSIIFNITLPAPIGYPNVQRLILINYSGLISLINPWIISLNIGNKNYEATSMVAYQAIYINNSNLGFLVPYVANIGLPTAFTIYESYSKFVSMNSELYITKVAPFPSLNLINTPSTNISSYTLTDELIYSPSGYLALKSNPIGINNPNNLKDTQTEWEYLPSLVLNYTYIGYTLADQCSDVVNNYELHFISSRGVYWAYQGSNVDC